MTPVLEIQNLKKSYGDNAVLKGVSFTMMPGEIRGVIGENGAGKSTMMNIIFGMSVIHSTGGYQGRVVFNGQEVSFKSPVDAIKAGFGMVHQEFMLIPELSIFENIKLNREITKKNFLSKITGKKLELLDIQTMRADAKKALSKVGLTIDELLPVAGLPVGHMQFIEIAREIDHDNIKFLVFDEPTAVLGEDEAKVLLKTMKHLAKEMGIAILFISHRLDEIVDACDTITILRDGELVGNYNRGELTAADMAEKMVGRKVEIEMGKGDRKFTDDDTILSLENLYVEMPGEQIKGLNLKIRRGEILGLGGLAGQGKVGVANGIAGLYPARGKIIKDGKPLPLKDPMAILKAGITFLSEDRRGVGLLLDQSIEDNIAFTAMAVRNDFLLPRFKALKLVDRKRVADYAEECIKSLDVRCTSRKQHVRALSGGNQQKVCMSRVIATKPEILFVSEPTRGVDIGAKKLILDKLKELNNQGMTIVVTSSELLELRSICDRIAIIAEGNVAAILSPLAKDADFGLAMAS